MRIFAVIACIMALMALSISGKNERLRRIHAECQAESAYPIDGDLMKRAMRGEPVDESALGPHFLCMHVRGGIQSQNGDIIRKRLKIILNERIDNNTAVEEIMKKCGHRNGGTPEETAVALNRCLYKHARIYTEVRGHHGAHESH